MKFLQHKFRWISLCFLLLSTGVFAATSVTTTDIASCNTYFPATVTTTCSIAGNTLTCAATVSCGAIKPSGPIHTASFANPLQNVYWQVYNPYANTAVTNLYGVCVTQTTGVSVCAPVIYVHTIDSFDFTIGSFIADSDSDGYPDVDDAFPNNAAAGQDANNDGYADSWSEPIAQALYGCAANALTCNGLTLNAVLCTAGNYWNGTACVNADPGHYVPAAEATSEISCVYGMTYQPLYGQTSCNTDTPACTVGVSYQTTFPTLTNDRVCTVYTPVQNCATYSPTADSCTRCSTGYSNLSGPACLPSQYITLTTPPPITATINSSFNVAATASSGLPVSITTMDSCTGGGTDSATITMTGTSTDCTILYDQAGDGTNYDTAPELAFLVSLPKAVSHDYDGDGMADILFLNTSSGSTKYWSDANKTQSIYVGTYNLAYAYQGSGDFDGDGKADLLFVNTSTNATLIWSGAVKTAATYPGTGAAGYNVAAICDTDGDGKDDIVWFNATTGSTRIWPAAVKAAVTYPGIQNTAYAIVACADFDGDKRADLFWRNNTTGADQVWFGGSKSYMMYPGTNADLTVQVVGAGDTDGDGQADMVWYMPSTNSIRVWLGGLKAASTYLGTGATGFTPKAMADYDGDGMVDLLWANDMEDVRLWVW
jgi:hypothetical protein